MITPQTAVSELCLWLIDQITGASVPAETMPVPRGWTPPYVGLAGTTEDADNMKNQPGHLGTETLHCWGRDKRDAQLVYSMIYPRLHACRVDLPNHRGIGRLSYETDRPDPQGLGHQVVARFRVLSQVLQ